MLSLLLVRTAASAAPAETPQDQVKLLTRVHGGLGSFLPVGIRIGEDAIKRLNAKPRELTVTFYQATARPVPARSTG